MKHTAHIITSFVFGLLAYVIFTNTVSAQAWTILPSGVTNDLNNISCPTASICYVVGGAPFIGGAGIVLKTTNGGDTWVTQTIPTSNPIRGISCPSVSICYAAGDNAAVLKTTNGGDTWVLQPVPEQVVPYAPRSRPWFWDIWTVDSEGAIAVAVGNVGAVYRTINGGDTWSQIDVGTVDNLHGVFFVNDTTGWIMGSGGRLLKSTDGGASWTVQNPSMSTLLWDMESLDGITAWLSGGELRKTVNGGDTWSAMPTPVYVTYRGIEFVNASLGWAVGSVIIKTINGGETWTWEASPTSVILRDVECESETLCFAVGDDGVIIRYGGVASVPVGRPDLTATISSLACGAAPTYFHYIVSVSNNGTAAAGSFTTKVESINESGDVIGTAMTHTSSGLAIEESTVYDNSIPPDFFNPSGAASVTIRVRVDTLSEVAELSEDNNSATLTTTCAVAQITPSKEEDKKKPPSEDTKIDTSTKTTEDSKDTADKTSETTKSTEPTKETTKSSEPTKPEETKIDTYTKPTEISKDTTEKITETLPKEEVKMKAEPKKESDARKEQIEKIKDEAPKMLKGMEKFIQDEKLTKEARKEKLADDKIKVIAKQELTELEEKKKEKVTDAMKTFIAYGTDTTKILGEGERAGLIASFKQAFGRLPETQEDWEDVIKIGNGRFPSKKNYEREKYAEGMFKKIYLRAPDRTDPHDDAAVTIIAYGLRTGKRDLKAEAAAIKIFKSVFNKTPKTAEEWDIVRAIAYSGAKRR